MINIAALPKLKAGINACLALIFCLLVAMLALRNTKPPKPLTGSAPASQFSAGRAMQLIKQIAVKPHPSGTPANAEVRSYLISQLKALGLTPELQLALATQQSKHQPSQDGLIGRVHNVLAKLPGTQSGKAVLLVAHYDSVPNGSGAADDAASVAAILETIRAIKTQPSLKNDVICLFTDGEEAGLLGAHAFVAQHPWAKEVGLVLNFEYRGNSGAFMMFETSPNNGKLIAGLATAVPAIQANSLMFEVYNRMPNDTDFTVFKQAGIPGMNFAAIDGLEVYHTALDTFERIDQGTLQHEGDIMLALVKQFGNQLLDNLTADNQIYFNLPGVGIVHYPQSWLMPLTVILVSIFVLVCVKTYLTKAVRLPLIIAAAIGFPLLMAVLFGINYGLLKAIKLLHFNHANTFVNDLFFIGLMLVDSVVFCAVALFCRKWLKPLEVGLGIACFWLVINGLLCQIPGATFLTVWPLLAVLLSYLVISFKANKIQGESCQLWLYALGILPVLILYPPIIKNLYIALTLASASVVLIPFCFALSVFAPLLIQFSHQNIVLSKCGE